MTRTEDYTKEQVFHVGDRVELHPVLDLWMAGARFGTVTKVYENGDVVVRNDIERIFGRRLRRRISYPPELLRLAR